MRKSILVAALMAGTFLPSMPTYAAFADFLSLTCGPQCTDPIGERSAAQQNWSALEAMGTTEFVGAEIDGKAIDPSSLLAAARVIGTTELDRWLRTGDIASAFSLDSVMQAMNVTGIDVGISGMMSSLGGAGGQGGVASAVGVSTWQTQAQTASSGSVVDDAYCNESIDSILNASAQAYVNKVVEAAESEMGFSQTGGQPASSDAHSENGLFGGSCLDIFMTGDKDTLFKPPQLGQLVSMMSQMYGAEAQGSCAGAPTVHQQVAGSTPMGAFATGKGGFVPGREFTGSDTAPALHRGNNYGLSGGSSETRSSGYTGLL